MRMGAVAIHVGLCMGFSRDVVGMAHVATSGCLRQEFFRHDDGAGLELLACLRMITSTPSGHFRRVYLRPMPVRPLLNWA